MPPTPPTAEPPRIWVQRTFPVGNASSFEETHLEAKQFATTPARVNAQASRTINLGNFESLRIQVGVELPCYPEEVDVALQEASTMVSVFLNQEEQAIKQQIGPNGLV